jgi:cytochrome oxidase Cu insertion factor (SCO1/SenC/PrrC family)
MRGRVRSRWVVVGLGAMLVLAGAGATAAPNFGSLGLHPYTPPKAAPEFTLPDLEGKVRTLAEFKGKVLLLFFWATW